MVYRVGVKITTTTDDGEAFTSSPTYIDMVTLEGARDLSWMIVNNLEMLMLNGIIDSYGVGLKVEADKEAPGATQ